MYIYIVWQMMKGGMIWKRGWDGIRRCDCLLFKMSQQQQVEDKIVHYKYVSRHKQSFNDIPFHKYNPHAIAKVSNTAIQIYHHFFISLWKRNASNLPHQAPTSITLAHFSDFFKIFMDIIILKSQVRYWKNLWSCELQLMSEICGDSHDTNDWNEELAKAVKDYIRSKIDQKMQDKQGQGEDYIERMKEIDKAISLKLHQFYKQCQYNIQQLSQSQFLPSFETSLLLRYIRYNFDGILSIRLLFYSPTMKANIMKHLKLVHDHMKIELPNIKFTGPENIIKKTKNINNEIYIKKESTQAEPIITPLTNYLRHYPQKNTQINHCLIRCILKDCHHYYSNTGYCLPHFSIKDIFFDQKRLTSLIDYRTLVMEIFGLAQNKGNMQNRIAMGLSPNDPDSQKCFLQMQQNFEYMVQKNWFKNSLADSPRIGQEQECQYCKIQSKNIKDPEVRHLLENVHVWRIITIFYFIKYRSELSKDLYQEYLQQLQPMFNTSSHPFTINHYQQVLRLSYQRISNGQIHLENLLISDNREAIKRKVNRSDIRQRQRRFDFTLKDLRDLLNIQTAEDALLDDVKFTKNASYLYFRMMVIKQIQTECNFKKGYFRKMPNSQLYLLTICILIYEHLYSLSFTVWQERAKENIRRQMKIYYSKNYNNTILNSQSKKRQELITKMFEKVEGYGRNRESKQYKFLQQKRKLVKTVKDTYNTFIEIIKMDQHLNIQSETNTLGKDYEDLLDQIEVECSASLDSTKLLLREFIQFFNDGSSCLQDIHKLNELSATPSVAQQLAKIHHKKMILMLGLQLRLTHNNWASFQQLFLNFICGNNRKGSTNEKHQVMQAVQMVLIWQKLLFVDKIISKEPDFNYKWLRLQKKSTTPRQLYQLLKKEPLVK